MGRRKRRIIRTLRKTLPKVFTCPQCGVASVRVSVKKEGTKEMATVACGSCGLSSIIPELSGKKESIDIYNDFIDRFMVGQTSA